MCLQILLSQRNRGSPTCGISRLPERIPCKEQPEVLLPQLHPHQHSCSSSSKLKPQLLVLLAKNKTKKKPPPSKTLLFVFKAEGQNCVVQPSVRRKNNHGTGYMENRDAHHPVSCDLPLFSSATIASLSYHCLLSCVENWGVL